VCYDPIEERRLLRAPFASPRHRRAMAEKRKLPVLNRSPESPDEAPRPPWHWVGFGAVLVFAAWLPLAWIAEGAKRRVIATLIGPVADAAGVEAAMNRLAGSSRIVFVLATLGLPALAMAVGAAAAGYVVGRYGGTTTAREAGLAGVASGLLACALAWTTAGFSAPLVGIVLILGPAAWIGGRRGVEARRA
jgi:hypothetical protein